MEIVRNRAAAECFVLATPVVGRKRKRDRTEADNEAGNSNGRRTGDGRINICRWNRCKTATYPCAGGARGRYTYTGNNIAAIILRNRQIRQQNVYALNNALLVQLMHGQLASERRPRIAAEPRCNWGACLRIKVIIVARHRGSRPA